MASALPPIGTVSLAATRGCHPRSLGCKPCCRSFAQPVTGRAWRWLTWFLALSAAGLVGETSTAWATVGVGVQAAPVAMSAPARPGTTSAFPSVYVINTGTQSAEYSLKVERLSTGDELAVPDSWVSFGEQDFMLRPHRATTVAVRLKLPSTASAGQYMTDIVASTSARGSGSAAAGAAAATKLVFTVVATSSSGLSPSEVGAIAAGSLAVVVGIAAGRKRRRRGDRHRRGRHGPAPKSMLPGRSVRART